VRVSVVQCRGAPYKIGQHQGRVFATSRRGLNFRRSKVGLPSWFDMHAEERFYTKFAPAILEEIAGIANALDTSLERACLFFGNGGLRPRLGGCSAVMSASAFARNYDFQPQNYGARLALVQPTGSYASIGFSELLTGRLDGMNEHGLSVALHLVGRRRLPGMSCVLMIRIVLDQCSTTDEAVEMFRRLPHAVAYNYSILDASGRAAVVEAMPGAFYARRGSALACTNHFQSPAMRPYNRARSRTSWTRLPPLEAWATEGLVVEALFEALNRSSSPAFFGRNGNGRFGTLHTIATEPSSKLVQVGVGGDASVVRGATLKVNFKAWTEGEDLAISELTGVLGGVEAPSVRSKAARNGFTNLEIRKEGQLRPGLRKRRSGRK
jgi:predicted choloylglycine hydrolase